MNFFLPIFFSFLFVLSSQAENLDIQIEDHYFTIDNENLIVISNKGTNFRHIQLSEFNSISSTFLEEILSNRTRSRCNRNSDAKVFYKIGKLILHLLITNDDKNLNHISLKDYFIKSKKNYKKYFKVNF